MTRLGFVVPGRLDQITGGYLFDRRVVEGLRARGREVLVAELEGEFPAGDAAARAATEAALARFPDGMPVVLDGLALAGAEACLEREAARLRLVGFVHHALALETGLPAAEAARLAALERRLLPLFRGILCPSERTAASLAGYGVPRGRIAIVPPGVEKPPRPAPRRAASPVRLVCVGTLTPRKGHAVLIEALAPLAEADWQLLCIGSLERDPATVAALRRRIDEAGLARRVALAGEWPPDRLGEAYAAADCFVLASWYEGYGMVFAEAMAHGLPIVATRGGAIPEVVPPEAGLLVPPGDAAALGAALRRVIVEDGLRDRLAAGALRAAAALPSWETAVARWEAELDRLAG